MWMFDDGDGVWLWDAPAPGNLCREIGKGGLRTA